MDKPHVPYRLLIIKHIFYVQFFFLAEWYTILLNYVHIFFRHTKEDTVVRLGEYDFTTDNETKYIDYRLSDIRLHPDYSQATHENDIAILRLKRPTIYSSFIRPICLPKTNMEVYKKNAVVAGKN